MCMRHIPINTVEGEVAFAIRTRYESHCYVNALNGGGHFPTTAVMEVYDYEERDV